MNSIQQNLVIALSKEKKEAREAIQAIHQKLNASPDYKKLTDDQKTTIEELFSSVQKAIDTQDLIAMVRDKKRTFSEDEYIRILSQIANLSNQSVSVVTGGVPDGKKTGIADRVEVVSGHSIIVEFPRPLLADDQDVEDYIQMVKQAYLKEIKNGKQIKI